MDSDVIYIQSTYIRHDVKAEFFLLLNFNLVLEGPLLIHNLKVFKLIYPLVSPDETVNRAKWVFLRCGRLSTRNWKETNNLLHTLWIDEQSLHCKNFWSPAI